MLLFLLITGNKISKNGYQFSIIIKNVGNYAFSTVKYPSHQRFPSQERQINNRLQ